MAAPSDKKITLETRDCDWTAKGSKKRRKPEWRKELEEDRHAREMRALMRQTHGLCG